jgi:hypothetical protein
MDQSLLVGMVQRLGHRRHQFDRLVDRQPGLLEPRSEIGAVDVLRDDVAGKLVRAADIVNRHDVGVIEVGDGAGFGQIGFGGFGAIHQLAMRHLDGDRTLQLSVVSQVNQAEAAFAKESFHPIAPDLLGLSGIDRRRQIHGGRLERASTVGIVHGHSWSQVHPSGFSRSEEL